MKKITEHSGYLVGIKEFDQQHEELFVLTSALRELVEQEVPYQIISERLTLILRKTKDHFLTEENLLFKHSYPGYNKQKAEHESFLNKLAAMANDICGTERKLALALVDSVVQWFEDHISGADAAYAEYLREHGVH
jgi:hemerythrin